MTTPRDISIDAYDYPLPDNQIAKYPLAQRDECKLLVRHRNGELSEHIFNELPHLLDSESLIVCNDTKVINARLRFRKGADSTGALIEIFCLEPNNPVDFAQSFASTNRCSWNCFVGNSKRWKNGLLTQRLQLANGQNVTLCAERIGRSENVSEIEFTWTSDAPENQPPTFSEIIESAGEIPIPPYLNRSTEESDTADYQTMFNRIEGSVAAPTAGLHFTPAVMDNLRARGIERRDITLHVGAGTFQPVKSDTIGDHEMHSEFISVDLKLIDELANTQKRIVAVGTTSVRTLESLYHLGCRAWQNDTIDHLPQWYAYNDSHPRLSRQDSFKALASKLKSDGSQRLVATTQLIIAPGYSYNTVDAIVTNFHQPRSTLLLLVSAFTKGDWKPLYGYALSHGFRFLSYGDACLLL